MTETKKNTNLVAIITMCFIFAMISFVTNMAAPFGTIWGNKFEWSRMAGNLMNFAAYLFMGIPAGKMLLKVGYKKTTLIALATGLVGVIIQWLSSRSFLDVPFFGANFNWAIVIYLLGAFVCGFCVCMLNTVVNPMLNILGGGGNKGNQYIQIGGTLNSLTGTLTPLLVGALIGTVTAQTSMADVTPLLFIAMAVFAIAFIIISFLTIPEPAKERKTTVYEHSAWNFRHFVLGAVAIFMYVGIEIGIPSQVNFFLADASAKGAGIAVNGAAIGGAIAAVYWLLMLVGRFASSVLSGKIAPRTQLTFMTVLAIVLLLVAIFMPEDVKMTLRGAEVPAKVLPIILCGICTSIMWGVIFNLATEGLGKHTASASGLFMTMVVGGGLMPLLQDMLAKQVGDINSYWLVIAMLVYILYFAAVGSKVQKA